MKSADVLMLLCLCAAPAAAQAPSAGHAGQASDPRLREVVYDPKAVVTVPVKRGVVTLVMLDADEVIAEVASGLGGDCAKADAAWCIAAQAGGRNLFVKPKSTASAANTVAVVTDRRSHAFRFVVLADGDPKPPVYRLVVKAPVTRAASPARHAARDGLPPALLAPLAALLPPPATPTPQQVVAERLQGKPQVLNSSYSVAEGDASEDIVPALVFDLDGVPPERGTTVPGVRRSLKADSSPTEQRSEVAR